MLQSDRVFANVSKGVLAKNSDMEKAFGTAEEAKVCLIILEKGQLQVSSREREAEQESLTLDIVSTVVAKCINPETRRPFTAQMIESAMKEVNFVVRPNRTPKQQALQLIRELRAVIPIERAQMRLRLLVPRKTAKTVKEKVVVPLAAKVEEEEWLGGELEMVVCIDPGNYKTLEAGFQETARGSGQLEILDLQVRDGGDEEL